MENAAAAAWTAKLAMEMFRKRRKYNISTKTPGSTGEREKAIDGELCAGLRDLKDN